MAKKKPKIKTEIKAAEAKKIRRIEKEFFGSFMEQLLVAKEKREKEKPKIKKRKAIPEKKIAVIEKKLRPSIMRGRKMREKIKPLTIEEEKIEIPEEREEIVEVTPKPTPSAIEAPIYKRELPPLPKPPKKEWPMPPMPPAKAPARPPEEEATAPPTAELPTPMPAPIAPPAPIPPPPVKKPTPPLIALDLGKLNPLIADDSVSVIQCDGVDLPIRITKEGKVEKTRITLSEDEIKTIVQKFADRAGQPLSEPIFKAQVNNLIISAIISAFAGSKFVISKISQEESFL